VATVRQVLHRHCTRRARAQVGHVAVLLEHRERRPRLCVARGKDARARGQAFGDVVVEADVGELDRPRRGAFDVAAFDVAVAGTGVGRLGYADVHRERHLDGALGELAKGVLDGGDERGGGLEPRLHLVVCVQLGRREPGCSFGVGCGWSCA